MIKFYSPLSSLLAGVFCNFLNVDLSIAQVTSDRTTATQVRRDQDTFNITGGTTAGRNLFHSFREFSVPRNAIAHFQNADTIQNIFGRVTGGSASRINGIIRANGVANLFLLNPNGVIFGNNARLDIGGSFLATTANEIEFDESGRFGTEEINRSPDLLRVNPSALHFSQQLRQPAAIRNTSVALSGLDPTGDEVFGLRVPNGQSLVLLGGDVSTQGGGLHAYGGRIEVGAVGASGRVGLETADATWRLQFPADLERADVTFEDANVEVAAAGQGDITIHAHNLTFLNSFVNAGIDSGELLTNQAGDVILDATGHVNLGQDSRIENDVDAIGNSGNILIRSDTLALTAGSDISASVFGQGKAGDVDIVVRDRVSIEGFSPADPPSGINNNVSPETRGRAGNIRLSAASLTVTNRGRLDASVDRGGRAGNITINVSDSVVFDLGYIFSILGEGAIEPGGDVFITAGSLSLLGGSQLITIAEGEGTAGDIRIAVDERISIVGADLDGFSTGIFSSGVSSGVRGTGGNIFLSADSLNVNNAFLNASMFGRGRAGNITINARDSAVFNGGAVFNVLGEGGRGQGGNITVTAGSLSLLQGAQLLTATRGEGNAGTTQINVDGHVLIDGFPPEGFPKLPGFTSEGFSGIYSSVDPGAEGNGGDIRLSATSLSLTNGGLLDVSAFGRGRAGDITISNVETVLIDRAAIAATTTSGDGGNISLNNLNVLNLRNGSSISATAGESGASGNGGNITINGNFLVANPVGNSDITANAFEGAGGQITLTAEGILGLNSRSRDDLQALLGTTNPAQLNPQLLPTSDITAISQTDPNLSGQVTLNAPDINPEQGITSLPNTLIDTTQQINPACSARAGFFDQNQFVVTGRGGLPTAPTDALSEAGVSVDLGQSIAPELTDNSENLSIQDAEARSHSQNSIIEAQGWRVDEQGNIVLTADGAITSQRSLLSPGGCFRTS